jgi:hypothetical protein
LTSVPNSLTVPNIAVVQNTATHDEEIHMTATTAHPTRSQAFRPGKYVPLSRITGAEILDDRHPVAVEVAKTTIHGKSSQIFDVGLRVLRAAIVANPALLKRPELEAPELAGSI